MLASAFTILRHTYASFSAGTGLVLPIIARLPTANGDGHQVSNAGGSPDETPVFVST